MNIEKINEKTNKVNIVIDLIKKGYTFTEAIKKIGLKNEKLTNKGYH